MASLPRYVSYGPISGYSGPYRKFVEDEGYEQEGWWKAGGYGEFSRPENWDDQLRYPSLPVVGVSWFEAAAYCRWANCRLPTEAEWERAARGTGGRRYPWGDEGADPSRLNFGESGIGHVTPVGIYPLGTIPDGICDLAGNVREWCADLYGPYVAKASHNPSVPQEASLRVIRGGGWSYDAWFCRAAFRDWYEPQYRYGSLGFRVALVPPSKQVRPSKPKRTEPGAKVEGAKRRSPTPRAGVEGGEERR